VSHRGRLRAGIPTERAGSDSLLVRPGGTDCRVSLGRAPVPRGGPEALPEASERNYRRALSSSSPYQRRSRALVGRVLFSPFPPGSGPIFRGMERFPGSKRQFRPHFHPISAGALRTIYRALTRRGVPSTSADPWPGGAGSSSIRVPPDLGRTSDTPMPNCSITTHRSAERLHKSCGLWAEPGAVPTGRPIGLYGGTKLDTVS
jgi:hypothetical protein